MDDEFNEIGKHEKSTNSETQEEPLFPPMRGVQLIEEVKAAMYDSKRVNF